MRRIISVVGLVVVVGCANVLSATRREVPQVVDCKYDRTLPDGGRFGEAVVARLRDVGFIDWGEVPVGERAGPAFPAGPECPLQQADSLEVNSAGWLQNQVYLHKTDAGLLTPQLSPFVQFTGCGDAGCTGLRFLSQPVRFEVPDGGTWRVGARRIKGSRQLDEPVGAHVIVMVDDRDDLEATVVVSPTSNREQQGRLVPTVAVIGATDLLYTVNDAVFARRPITFPDASVPDASVPASSWSDGVSAADCDGGSTLETNAYRSPGRDGFGFVTTHAGVSPSGEAPPSGTATMWFKWRGSGLFAPNGLPTTVFAACVKKPDAKEPKSCDRLVVIEEGYLKMSDGGARVAVEPDVWHHLALTWSDSTTRLWLDGVDHRLVGAASPAGKSLVYGGIRALTSWGYAGSDCYAVIDDLQLWKREISREEIIESMLRPKRCR